MKFTTAATTNPIDQLKVIGKPLDRVDGPLKTTGQAPYAYEHHVAVPDAAYGYMVPAAIAKGRMTPLLVEPMTRREPFESLSTLALMPWAESWELIDSRTCCRVEPPPMMTL